MELIAIIGGLALGRYLFGGGAEKLKPKPEMPQFFAPNIGAGLGVPDPDDLRAYQRELNRGSTYVNRVVGFEPSVTDYLDQST